MQFPVVIAAQGASLIEIVQSRSTEIRSLLNVFGAVLIRGATVRDEREFAHSIQTFAPQLMESNGEHNAVPGCNGVFTPVEYSSNQTLLWHNENSFDIEWPDIIAFCCHTLARQGGETTLVDSCDLLRQLNQDIVAEFRSKGVRYIRTMGLELGRTWQETFCTRDKLEFNAICKQREYEVTWLSESVVRTTCLRPAVVRHHTGREAWFNQAQHWHPAALPPDVRLLLHNELGAATALRNCTFGDGSIIPDDIMLQILDTYRHLQRSVDWQQRDVLIVDNVLVAHGRNAFVGPRRLLVAMGKQELSG